MGELLGMRVETDHPELFGKILDVRLDRVAADRFVMRQFVVGPGRPGSLLGYDRGDFNGPWLVRVLVERLHRHIRLVECSAVQHVDWDRGVVWLDSDIDVEAASLPCG